MDRSDYFDANGRCIPSGIKAEHHLQTRRYFLLNQPEIDYKNIYYRLNKYLNIGNEISLEEFTSRAESILDKLSLDPACKNILNGVHIPFMLPKQSITELGSDIESIYIQAVKNSFEDLFPDKTFTNHFKNNLSGKLRVAEGSRHDQLIERMKHDSVVGYYFPCLMEYSIPATIEQIGKLPSSFLLAGGFDTSAALIGCPDLLIRKDGYPPVIWFSGLETEKQGIGYHFEAYGYHLTFNRKAHFERVAESWTSGLVVIG